MAALAALSRRALVAAAALATGAPEAEARRRRPRAFVRVRATEVDPPSGATGPVIIWRWDAVDIYPDEGASNSTAGAIAFVEPGEDPRAKIAAEARTFAADELAPFGVSPNEIAVEVL